MNGMTVNERLEDIKRRTGYSENVIRAVLNAEAESILDSLKRGERATMIERVTIVPSLETKFNLNGTKTTYIDAKPKLLSTMKTKLAAFDRFERTEGEEDYDDEPGIMTSQITSLL